jgi:hypothetical protein
MTALFVLFAIPYAVLVVAAVSACILSSRISQQEEAAAAPYVPEPLYPTRLPETRADLEREERMARAEYLFEHLDRMGEAA